jgi:hypothetical protein
VKQLLRRTRRRRRRRRRTRRRRRRRKLIHRARGRKDQSYEKGLRMFAQ